MWNPNVYKIYKLMCAWIFKDLIARGEFVKAKRVYYLAHRYIEIDETVFEQLLKFFKQDNVDDEKVRNMISHYKNDIETIYTELSQYKDYLEYSALPNDQ